MSHLRMRLFLVFLTLGLTILPGRCRSQDPSKTLVVTPIADSPSFAKRALIVGVHNYEHATKLSVTTEDARAVADLLRTRFAFPPEAITLMTDDPDTPDTLKPTYLHLRSAFKTLLNGVNESSEVVIFFSGHGTRFDDKDWLVPQDGLPDDVVSSCINYDQIKQELETKRPHRALLIVDACRNLQEGKETTSSGFGGSKGLYGPQIAELLSCLPKEVSKEGKPEDFHQSVFTHFVLQGLSGDREAVSAGTHEVTFDSLKLYVAGKVSQYVSSRYGESQNPDGRATLGAMVLARGEMSRPVEQTTIKLLDTQAALLITSNPSGADVIVDGKTVGRTPYTLTTDLGLDEKKTQRIGLSRSGYQPGVFEVDLLRGKTLTVPLITLKAVGGGGSGHHVASTTRPKHPKQGDVWVNPKDGAEMVFIPAGPFLMGDSDSPDNLRHTVTLSGYWIYKNVVTVGMYKKFCAETGRQMPPEVNFAGNQFNPHWSKENHPIVNVSWYAAKAYCDWAGVCLPTEAQWEKAARGTDGRKFPWGDEYDASKLRCSKGSFGDAGGTAAVGSYGVSPYGVTDMAGNVWQWCSDWYDANYWSNSASQGVDPENQSVGDQKYRVLRGGSWKYATPVTFRSVHRNGIGPESEDDGDGFRGALGPHP